MTNKLIKRPLAIYVALLLLISLAVYSSVSTYSLGMQYGRGFDDGFGSVIFNFTVPFVFFITTISLALDALDISQNGVQGHWVPEGEAITANQEISLVSIPNPGEEDLNKLNNLVSNILPQLKFKVIYSSTYKDSLEYYGNGDND